MCYLFGKFLDVSDNNSLAVIGPNFDDLVLDGGRGCLRLETIVIPNILRCLDRESLNPNLCPKVELNHRSTALYNQ